MTEQHALVTGGVDTHKDTLAVAALNGVGGLLGQDEFPATPAGYRSLLTWLSQYGEVSRVGVEGTGSYGAGLSRYLRAQGIVVVEVDRPDRRLRRQRGKSDPVDAVAAARAAQAETATGTPKAGTGPVESIRALRVARRSAMKARTQAANQLHALVVRAPEPLRTTLRSLSRTDLVRTASALRPGPSLAEPVDGAKAALRAVARRYQALHAEIVELDGQLAPLVTAAAPALLELPGIGIDIAGQLLVTAGDNPERLRNEASFAALCGVSPRPASSGKSSGRHRLNRGGDRAANSALYLAVLNRKRYNAKTRDYVARRTTEGLSNREITRCLKRYLAREVYRLLTAPVGAQSAQGKDLPRAA
jgi:transposase